MPEGIWDPHPDVSPASPPQQPARVQDGARAPRASILGAGPGGCSTQGGVKQKGRAQRGLFWPEADSRCGGGHAGGEPGSPAAPRGPEPSPRMMKQPGFCSALFFFFGKSKRKGWGGGWCAPAEGGEARPGCAVTFKRGARKGGRVSDKQRGSSPAAAPRPWPYRCPQIGGPQGRGSPREGASQGAPVPLSMRVAHPWEQELRTEGLWIPPPGSKIWGQGGGK